MDDKQANQMINLLASIEKKMTTIIKAIEDKKKRK